MAASNLDKLKSRLDFSLVSKFDEQDIRANLYIPLCIVNNIVYVVVTPETQNNTVKTKINDILGTDKLKFAKVESSDFEEFLSSVFKKEEVPVYEPVTEEENKSNTTENIPTLSDTDLSQSNDEIQLKYDTDENEGDLIRVELRSLCAPHHLTLTLAFGKADLTLTLAGLTADRYPQDSLHAVEV